MERLTLSEFERRFALGLAASKKILISVAFPKMSAWLFRKLASSLRTATNTGRPTNRFGHSHLTHEISHVCGSNRRLYHRLYSCPTHTRPDMLRPPAANVMLGGAAGVCTIGSAVGKQLPSV